MPPPPSTTLLTSTPAPAPAPAYLPLFFLSCILERYLSKCLIVQPPHSRTFSFIGAILSGGGQSPDLYALNQIIRGTSLLPLRDVQALIPSAKAAMYDHAPLPTAPSQSLPAEVAEILLSPTLSYIASATFSQSAAFSAMATAASSNRTSGGESRSGAENGECKLLGPFALFVQGALGLLALLSLVFKRWRERPQRPVKIWAFDASKQVVGSALLHAANLLMSMLSSGELTVKADHYQANPCSFYLLNLAIDTTIGIPILVVLLRLLTHAFSLTPLGNPPESIHSGNYGRPPKTKWWLKQSFIYFLGLLGMKCCVFIIFQLCPWIIRVGDWALRWTEGDEMVQVFFVMLFFPVVMNALQYYIIDSFIKDQKPLDHEAIPSEDEDGSDIDENRRRHSFGAQDGADDSDIREETTKDGTEVKVREDKDKSKLRVDPKMVDEYDPRADGEGSGSSGEVDGPKPSPDDTGSVAKSVTTKES